MKRIILVTNLLLIFSFFMASSQGWKNYPYQPEGSLLQFPNDEGRHPDEPIEWWYTVGHITGETTGTHYTYMLTYFYAPKGPFQGFRILNVSNDDTGEFYDDTQAVNYAILATDSLNIHAKTGFFGEGSEQWMNKTDTNGHMIPFEYELKASAVKCGLDLSYISSKPPLILGENGLLNQGEDSYTYYYSQSANSVSGTFTFKGFSEPVTGTSWIDRQFGTINPYEKEPYEWFCVQLSNGMDINIWNLFNKQNEVPDTLNYKFYSSYVDENTSFTSSDFELTRLAYHFTDDLAKCYSQKWHFKSVSKNIDLVISTLHHNSEVALPFRFYEGATTVSGFVDGVAVTGVGFAELIHGYEHPILELSAMEDNSWNTASPIRWTLQNSDDGLDLLYDLEISTDNKQSYTPIATALTDTSYLWKEAPYSNGEQCWFKVKAYSMDTTLFGETVSLNALTFKDISTSLNLSSVLKTRLRLYPNPTSGLLHISLSNKASFKQYEVMNMSGRVLIHRALKTQVRAQLETTVLSKGIYFMRVETTDGEAYTGRFVVK